MTTRVLVTPADRDAWSRFLEGQKLPMTVEVTKGKHRTSRQNRLQRQWMLDFAEQLPEQSAEEWRGYCKLHFGIPILRAASEEYAEVYDAVIRPLQYEQKLKAMMIPIDMPVTSKMTTVQKKAYLGEIQKFAAGRGVELTDPEALKWNTK